MLRAEVEQVHEIAKAEAHATLRATKAELAAVKEELAVLKAQVADLLTEVSGRAPALTPKKATK